MAGGRAGGWRGSAAASMAPVLTVSVLWLAGCEEAPAPAPVAASTPAPTVAAPGPAAPGRIVLSPQPDADVAAADAAAAASGPNGVPLVNDPSAPADTPLCGTAAREVSAIGRSLLPQRYAAAGVCAGYACYDPATATYIGLDGYRHVCR